MESPSDVLGVPAGADEDEIERAYRERVKEAHPDQGGSVEEFQAVRTAYEQLLSEGSDPISPDPTSEERRSNGGATGGRTGTGDAAAGTRSGSDDRVDEGEQREVAAEVTYLNYDVLSDFGWDVEDEGIFGKAAAEDLDESDFGQFEVEAGETLLEAAESRGFAWPFACRGGACANCAIKLVHGELSMPVNHILPSEMMERGIRLSCNAVPITEEIGVVYNVKHMPELEELLLPPRPYEQAYGDD